MKIMQNPASVWDAIWSNSVDFDLDNILLLIEDTKKSQIWRQYSSLIENNFGGWHNVRSIEIGSGIGWHSIVAATEGAQVHLIDYSQTALELARKYFEALELSGIYIYGDAFELAKNMKGKFNLSWSFGTAEHFMDSYRQIFFNLHFDFLEKNGITIISCPNAYSINYRIWMYLAKKYNEWEFGLEIPYSKNEYLKRLKRSEQKLINIIYDEGRPCLIKAFNILKRNNRVFYLIFYPFLKLYIMSRIKIHPFNKRSIILVAQKYF